MRSIVPSEGSLFRVLLVVALGAALTVTAAAAAPERAEAQVTHVHPDGKGIIGLALLGAEIGLFIPAIIQNAAHTNEWWPYLVFPLLGIAGGAVGGYFMEQATQTSAEIDVAFFVGALVLTVPTLIGTLALAAYTPSAESVPADEDLYDDSTSGSSSDSVEAVQDGSDASSDTTDTSATPDSSGTGTSSGTAPQSSLDTDAVVAGGPGLIRFDTDSRQVLLGVPLVTAAGTYTAEELAALHLTQTYDVRVPVVSASF